LRKPLRPDRNHLVANLNKEGCPGILGAKPNYLSVEAFSFAEGERWVVLPFVCDSSGLMRADQYDVLIDLSDPPSSIHKRKRFLSFFGSQP
jgi:hypothetical protein